MDYTYFLRQGSVTRTVAGVTLAALLLWATGLPMMFPTARAAQLTAISDVISDSDLGLDANHTVQFTTSTFIPTSGRIILTFPAGFDLTNVDFADIDLATSSDYTLVGACAGSGMAAVVGGQVITFTECGNTGIATSTVIEIQIGTNAAAGVDQINNHATAASYEITLSTDAGSAPTIDSGTTRIVIIDDVTVTASVNSIFTFTIAGVASSQTVNGTTTTGVSTATTIPFGTLSPNVVYTMAQDLTVNTNAAGGFVVTVFEDNNLESATTADIDNFIDSDGNGSSTPVAWQSPSGLLGVERTYGHMGITSDDTDYFAVSDTWAGDILAVPRAIFAHTAPTDGTVTGQGTTRVGYQIEISNLQEAGQDYSNTLTYIATPTF